VLSLLCYGPVGQFNCNSTFPAEEGLLFLFLVGCGYLNNPLMSMVLVGYFDKNALKG